jgi:O-antigen biosynthesis protein
MTDPSYDLSIIIVSYNTAGLLRQCLDSLEKHLAGKTRFTTVVVDNNSVDGTRAMLDAFKGGHAWLQTILLAENAGFARANNAGIRLCSSRNVLLLNSDTYLIDDSLLRAVSYLDAQPDVFGCGVTLLDRDLHPDVSFGSFPTLSIVVREIVTNRFNSLRGAVPRVPGRIETVDFPCGAFFLMKRTLLDKVGLLDERFFMYFEEADLARRARDMGFSIACFGPARIVHLRGGSSGSGGGALTPVFYRSWNLYFGKHHSAFEKAVLNLVLFSYFSAMTAVAGVIGKKSIAGYFSRQLRGLVRAWRAGPKAYSL